MSNFSKKVFLTALVGVVSLSACGISYAADSENSVTGFFRRLFNYPVKATEKTGEMTANTLQNMGEKIISPVGENTAGILQGDLSKTGTLATDAVTGTLETAGQTTSETAQIPVGSVEATQ